MHRSISVTVDSPVTALMPTLADLSTYPHWLGLVYAVEPETGDEPAYVVTLRAKVGPFSRSKKLRMVRTELTDSTVRFERAETDGRQHSGWVMTINAQSEQSPETTNLEIGLAYDGDLWVGPLESILDSQASKAGGRLSDYVSAQASS